MKAVNRILSLLFIGVSLVSAMTDQATGISFSPNKNGLQIFGVGTRKKGPIKVYSVAMYCTEALKNSLASLSYSGAKEKALQTLCSGAKDADACTFMLEMAFKVGAEKMASAISDSVSPRHKGDSADVERLRQIIFEGIPADTGATKGTTFQFDCSKAGISIAINGKGQGDIPSEGLAKAFCDVYLDDETVSPALRESILENCCAP